MIERELLGNTLWQYLVAAATFAGVLWAFILARRVILDRLKALAERTATGLDDLAVELLGRIKSPECYLLAFYIATRPLAMADWGDRGLFVAVFVVLTYRAITLLERAAAYAVENLLLGDGRLDAGRRGTARNVGYLVNAVIWAGGLIFALSNLGFNVSSMLAGLGIGGVAVALGAQAVLGDLFSAIAIFLDEPFVVGDFIIVGESQGSVEHIGIKTTRLRALSGETLVLPNSLLTSSRVRNFRKMHERRVVFAFGLVYQTPPETLKEIPSLVREIVAAQPQTRFDRAHFKGFGESSLDFEAVYYALSPDYNAYMDSNQAIHLGLLEAFNKKGIGFAYPTRTLFHEGPAAAAAPTGRRGGPSPA